MKKYITLFALSILLCNRLYSMDSTATKNSYRKNISFLLSIPQLAFSATGTHVHCPDYKKPDSFHTLTMEEVETIIQDLITIDQYRSDNNNIHLSSAKEFKDEMPTLRIFPALKHSYNSEYAPAIPRTIAWPLFWVNYSQDPELEVFLSAAYALNYFENYDYNNDSDKYDETLTDGHYKLRGKLREAFLSKNSNTIENAKAFCRETKSFSKPNLTKVTAIFLAGNIQDIETQAHQENISPQAQTIITTELTKAHKYLETLNTHIDSHKCILS